MSVCVRPAAASVLLTMTVACATRGGPVESPWPVAGPDDTVAVACAAVSGWCAAADSFEDSVEVRDARGGLVRTITRSDLQTLLPWMSLGGGPDGPGALAWSDSGRVLFICVHDAAVPGDGLGSDAILRYDASLDTLGIFARLELHNTDATWPHGAAAFFKGRLYVSNASGAIAAYTAPSSSTTGAVLATGSLPASGAVRGLTIDRDNGFLLVASDSAVYRASLAAWPPSFTLLGSSTEVRALAFGDHFGGAANRGLYVLRSDAISGLGRLDFVAAEQVYGMAPFAPALYATGAVEWHDVAAAAVGTLLIGADEDAVRIADSTDTRLSLDAWMADEFAQVVLFGKGLISPDSEPPGWVIDGDVLPGGTRFHPATPDAAAWVVCLLLLSDEINGDPAARGLVRQILMRYAGLSGVGPSRTADGHFRHWIDPFTGGGKPGWDPEFATLSTMLIVAAAARAADYYPADPDIARAASRIIFQVHNWDAYLQPGTDALYLKALPGGGPDPAISVRPFFEGFLFAEQAAAYGGPASDASYGRWLNRSLWPTAQYIPGRPITSTAAGFFDASFVSLYPLLLSSDYRASAAWRAQVQNIRWSAAAWTDDLGPRYFTVFSAGTTKPEWGGYRADSLGSHPGNISTFPSLVALCAAPSATNAEAEAVAAYEAYRKGARQTFKSGASILYRRSDVDRAYSPNSAGLPDVALGAIGLAERLRPGVIDAVLARPYPAVPPCAADWDRSGTVTPADVASFVTEWFGALGQNDAGRRTDADGNRQIEPVDIGVFINLWFAAATSGCPS